MEKKEKFNGCIINKKDLNRKDLFDIRQGIIDGVPISLIAKNFHIGEKRLRFLFSELIIIVDNINTYGDECKIGHKHVAYYTEEEQLLGIPNYTWEELSRTEQQFYINYGRKEKRKFKKARYSGIDFSLECSVRFTDANKQSVSIT